MKLINELNFKNNNLIIVCHAIKSLIPYISILSKHNSLQKVLIKPNSVDKDIIRYLENNEYNFELLDRNEFSSKSKVVSKLNSFTENKECILFDIGGYFSSIFDDSAVINNIIGIIEDTENGQQKYENKNLLNSNIPLFSIARSFPKETEDWWVGLAILFSAEKQLRTLGKTFNGKRILVIGFGKIGRSIAQSLQKYGYSVTVYDKDSRRLVHASCLNLNIIKDRSEFGKFNVIFSATGNKSISESDFPLFKKVCYFFSVTSSDDEFDIDFDDFNLIKGMFFSSNKNGNIYFCNKGNAVNFLDGGEIGYFAHMVQGAIVCAAQRIIDKNYKLNVINELESKDEVLLSDIYLETFL
ncbi:NAD(P)-dependent oxidoreductase [Vibrio mangrovi]|uniref:NAD(P)-dependent oxidoreductase n=1 Tax=Vibrio mangrovi TaxID=474394 RepID=A0A1Y6IR09_9VIBR|nr:NAD(P)-dependent oxidoreductase [Vibrio mangrovi]MDW6001889.1 NAD(P)-dependent oxidoreductase [Vibrio mangrovi]SMS00084.1 S-adenosyl-L-homocysteine hydrolase [Vibrio mangrovi]